MIAASIAGVISAIKHDRRRKASAASFQTYAFGRMPHSLSGYDSKVKPFLDRLLSFAGLIMLFPVFGMISLAVYIDDPGPIFFTQKRVGKGKHFFYLHKFRTMKMSTPHDVPTHQLKDPDQYITRVGRFLRKTSLDELPQIWDIFRGKMSVIGPRPALWNQADLVHERDRYGANDCLPGLTGWAQINGRDELEIPVKAKLDGEYVHHLRRGGLEAFFFDIRCFVGTITSVLRSEGVVEGGTGEMSKQAQLEGKRKKILVLSNVASMIVQFNMRNLAILQELGYDVEVACNFKEGNTCTDDVLDELKADLKRMNIVYHQVDFARGTANFRGQLSSFRRIEKLMAEEHYDVVFVMSAIAGIVARVHAKRFGCKVIYIAHGFQFYEGAPKSIWLLFFTLEKILSYVTDTIILTNEDDFDFAKRHFRAKETLFVPGVGVDIEAYEMDADFDRAKEKANWGFDEDDYIIFSAGELSERKNHRIVMDLVRRMDNKKIKYLICGIGTLEEEYRALIREWDMEDQIFLLGYQTDLKRIYGISDVFILPSLNEGLPVCLMMSLAAKTVSVCSDIRGNHELVRDSRYLFDPKDQADIERSLGYVMGHKEENAKIVDDNYTNLRKYDTEHVDKLMRKIFASYK